MKINFNLGHNSDDHIIKRLFFVFCEKNNREIDVSNRISTNFYH